ncbi:MAG: hypothetical protein LBF68_00250 [Christensenellaceae bacterium]|jgi:hypothetical protein|nr:hypothetical protein [Christensenellaceae bacterium]
MKNITRFIARIKMEMSDVIEKTVVKIIIQKHITSRFKCLWRLFTCRQVECLKSSVIEKAFNNIKNENSICFFKIFYVGELLKYTNYDHVEKLDCTLGNTFFDNENNVFDIDKKIRCDSIYATKIDWGVTPYFYEVTL